MCIDISAMHPAAAQSLLLYEGEVQSMKDQVSGTSRDRGSGGKAEPTTAKAAPRAKEGPAATRRDPNAPQGAAGAARAGHFEAQRKPIRSEEHTSELQSQR